MLPSKLNYPVRDIREIREDFSPLTLRRGSGDTCSFGNHVHWGRLCDFCCFTEIPLCIFTHTPIDMFPLEQTNNNIHLKINCLDLFLSVCLALSSKCSPAYTCTDGFGGSSVSSLCAQLLREDGCNYGRQLESMLQHSIFISVAPAAGSPGVSFLINTPLPPLCRSFCLCNVQMKQNYSSLPVIQIDMFGKIRIPRVLSRTQIVISDCESFRRTFITLGNARQFGKKDGPTVKPKKL